MNKIVLTLLVLISGFAVHAQFFVPHMGVTQTHSTQSVQSHGVLPTEYKAKSGTGFMFGIGYSAKMGEHLSFQPEIYYLQRSFSLKYTDSVNVGNSTVPQYNVLNSYDSYRIGYLEIPILLKYKFWNDRMFVTFGPYISVGLGGGHTYEYTRTFFDQSPSKSSGSDAIKFGSTPSGSNSNNAINRRTDIGIQPGIGIVVFKKMMLECRWDIGDKNLLKIRSSRTEALIFMLSYPLNVVPQDE